MRRLSKVMEGLPRKTPQEGTEDSLLKPESVRDLSLLHLSPDPLSGHNIYPVWTFQRWTSIMSEETTQGGTAPSTGPSYTTRVPTAIVTSRSRLTQNPRTGQPQPSVELDWNCFPETDHGMQQVHEFLRIQRATQVGLTDEEIDALRTHETTNAKWVTKTTDLIHAKLNGSTKTFVESRFDEGGINFFVLRWANYVNKRSLGEIPTASDL